MAAKTNSVSRVIGNLSRVVGNPTTKPESRITRIKGES
jgi:hypothetical protein